MVALCYTEGVNEVLGWREAAMSNARYRLHAPATLCASFAGGIFFCALLLLHLPWYLPAGILLALLVLALLLYRKTLAKRLLMVFFGAFLGALFMGLYGFSTLLPALSFAGTTQPVSASVADISQYDDGSFGYSLSVSQIGEQSFFVPFTLTLYSDEALDVSYGDQLFFTAELKHTSDDQDFGLFGSHASHGCYLTAKAVDTPTVSSDFSLNSLTAPFLHLRDRLTQSIDRCVSYPQSTVLCGILFGSKDEIPYHIYRAFDRSGVIHLLAVSGLHVSILSGLLLAFLRLLRCPQKLSSVLVIALLFAFAAMAGFSPSSVRAAVMAAISSVFLLSRHQVRSIERLAIAAAVVLLFQPYAVIGLSFLLSFGASLGIILFSVPIAQKLQMWSGRYGKLSGSVLSSLGISLSAMVFTSPLLMVAFGKLSIVSPVTNLLVTPILPAVFVFGLLAALSGALFPPLGMLFGYFAEAFCGILIWMTECISSFPFCFLPADNILVLVCVLGAGAILLLGWMFHKRLDVRSFCAYACAVLVFASGTFSFLLSPSPLSITILGSGYGSSILLQSPSAVVVINCGGGQAAGENLCRLLDSRGIRSIDALILTSSDKAHAQGANLVLEEFPAQTVYLPDNMLDGEIASTAQKAGDLVLPIEGALYSSEPLCIAGDTRSGELALDILINGVTIGYSQNFTALTALSHQCPLNVALVDAAFDPSIEDFSAGYVVLLEEEATPNLPYSFAPPDETTTFLVESNRLIKR